MIWGCVRICLGLMATTGFLFPSAKEPISSIQAGAWGHGVKPGVPYFHGPTIPTDGRWQPLQILSLCARMYSMPGWGTEACPCPGPDRSYLEWEWQQLCPVWRCHRYGIWSQPHPSSWPGPFLGWRVTAVTGRGRVGESGWSLGQGNGLPRTSPREAHPRRWDCAGTRGSKPLGHAPLSRCTSLTKHK